MDEKLDHLLSGSLLLFRKCGIRSVSMDDIARELGISKKTIYQYVANKPELVEKVLGYIFDNRQYTCLDTEAGDLNAIDTLLAVSRNLSRQMQNLSPLNAFELQKYYPAVYKVFLVNKREHVTQQVKRNMEQGISEGLYREDLDVDLVARLYIQRLVDVHDPEFMESADFSAEKVFQVMFDSHICGIVNAQGLAYYEKQINTSTINN